MSAFTDADRVTAREAIDEMRPLVDSIRDQFLVYMDHYAGDEELAFVVLVGWVNDLVSSGQLDRNCLVGMIAFAARRLHYHVPLLTHSSPN